jgi:hypothetical protein
MLRGTNNANVNQRDFEMLTKHKRRQKRGLVNKDRWNKKKMANT